MRRTRPTGRLAAALLLAAGLAACGEADPSPPTAADLEEIDVSVDHTITVDDDGYSPAALEIEAGEVVLLVNEGDGPHSFTADDQEFDTGRLLPGEDTTLVLTEPVTVTFHDLEAPERTGTLTVRTP